MKRILIATAAIVSYYVLFQVFYNMIAFGEAFHYRDASDAFNGFIHNFVPIFILFVLNLLIIFYLNLVKRLSTKIMLDVALSFLALFAVNMIYLQIARRIDWAGSVFNNIFIFLGLEVAFFVSNFSKSIREAEEQKRLALQYQYDSLKAQVNPHFLFNSLNILYSLVSIDPEKSKEFILSLSGMYRYIMSQQGKDRVPLKMEMDFLSEYISVLGMRYHNQFNVELHGMDNLGDQYIVPYTMQLLVENITKHNVISSRHHMLVDIVVGKEDIRISNPIVPRPSEQSTHMGLKYLTELYQHSGQHFHVENNGKTFTAIVPYLPTAQNSQA